MRAAGLAVLCVLLGGAGTDPTRIGDVSTTFRLLGGNDKITVERYDDPKVRNVSCYMSRARDRRHRRRGGPGDGPEPLLDRLPRDGAVALQRRAAG